MTAIPPHLRRTESDPGEPRAGSPRGEEHHDVVIVGTGFAGLCMAIKLKEDGRDDFVLLERGEEVGGTWRDNHYPGCACDVPSHLYSFSFFQNPDWSRKYPRQRELFDYLKRCAREHGLMEHVRFGTEVVAAAWDEEAARWTVDTAGGDRFSARLFVSAVGGLSRPSIPALPGLETFEGPSFHSADWDHDVDLAGKRVAVIGTGASAIQFVPQIAPEVAELHLFQRTPPWIVPRPDRAITRVEKLAYRTPLKWLYRWLLYWQHEMRAVGFVVDPRLMRFVQVLASTHLRRQVRDRDLRSALTPDYTIGCKRILISDDYYPAVARDNVELVTDGIAEIRPHSIVSRDGTERPVDAIVFGTGFQATDPLGPLSVRGRDGFELGESWKDGAEGYLGTTIAGFPNFFTLVGPNTGLGHNSMVFMIEAQVHYAMQCIRGMERRGLSRLALRAGEQKTFNERLQGKLDHAVWSSGCRSWYLEESGKNTTLWPSFTFDYWWKTRFPAFAHYEKEGEAASVPAPEVAPVSAAAPAPGVASG